MLAIAGAGLPAVLALAGCGGAAPDRDAPTADAVRVACGRAGETRLAESCTVERATTPAGLVLTLRRADGGFRRLLVTQDGRGVVAADGAERAVVTPIGSDRMVVALGDDRYQLPATVRAPGAAQ